MNILIFLNDWVLSYINKHFRIIIENHQNKNSNILAYYRSKILSSSLNAMLKLSKTTLPQKLFPSDCITLYYPEALRRDTVYEGEDTVSLYPDTQFNSALNTHAITSDSRSTHWTQTL